MRPLFIFLVFVAFSVQAQSPAATKTIPDFKSQPSVKWKFKISQPITASPMIEGGSVFFGGLDSVLYALDINSSKVQWKFRTKGAIRSAVLIHDNILFVNGGDGNLYAIEKKTGKLKWTFTGKGEKKYDFADYHHSTPILYNNTIYFGSGDGNLYAIRSDTGTKTWSYQTGDAVHTTPAIANNKVFVGSFDGYVYALDVTNGNLLWKFKTVGHRFFPRGEVQGSPAAAEGLVFIGARDYNVYALDQSKGFSHWNKTFTRGWCLVNTFYDSVLYTAGADERILIAADPLSGREVYRQKMEFLIFGGNAYSETMLYVGTTIGKLHGINMTTGEKIWSFATDGYTKHRLKYFGEDDSYRDDIYTIIKSNEQFLEVEYELGGIFSTPAIASDLIIFTTTEGTIYCLSR